MRRRELLRTLAVAGPAAAVTGGATLPVTAGGIHDARAGVPGAASRKRLSPVQTTEADWRPVAEVVGRPGTLSGGTVYRLGFPRGDLKVTSYGVQVRAGLSFGSSAAFARYRDGRAMMMGDLVVTEPELQHVTDTLHAHGLDQTALHKHLLSHTPDVWWTHFHAIGDPVVIAARLRATLDATATPPPAPATPPPPLDLDTGRIDAAFGTPGKNDGGIYKFTFAREETITIHDRVTPPAMGVTTGIGFQPVGGGKAAVNGDIVMTALEVQNVIVALRRGGIAVVELHNHALDDQPRLFYLHFWAVGDGAALARTIAAAVNATSVHPA